MWSRRDRFFSYKYMSDAASSTPFHGPSDISSATFNEPVHHEADTPPRYFKWTIRIQSHLRCVREHGGEPVNDGINRGQSVPIVVATNDRSIDRLLEIGHVFY